MTHITKALLVANNYIGTPHQLRGCHNDAENIKNLLVSHGTPSDRITILQEATRCQITTGLVTFLKESRPGDKLFIHFSGHGYHTQDQNGDEHDNKDEVFVATDGFIVDDEFNQVFVNFLNNGVRAFVVFDCCHSGTMLDLQYNITFHENEEIPFTITKKQNEPHINQSNYQIVCISGCLDNQQAADTRINGTFQGALTHCLIQSLEELDMDLRDLLLVLEKTTKRLNKTETSKFIPQHPVLSTNYWSF